MQKWEYLRTIIETKGDTIYQVYANDEHIFNRYEERGRVKSQPAFVVNHYLQTLGHDGWELINVMPFSKGGYTEEIHLYFKRPIE